MDVRELVTKWGFEVDDKPLANIEKKLDGIKERLSIIAGVEILRGAAELTEKFAKFGQELTVAAQGAGISVEAFQKLSFAAAKSSVSQDQLSAGLARLSRNLFDARSGMSGATKAFAKAGFTPDQVKGFKTSQEALLALSDKIKGTEDPIKRQAIAIELLGRGAYNMVPLLAKGSGAIKGMGDEAEKMGAVLSGPQLDALVKVEHSFMELFAVIKSVAAQIAATLAPEITEIIHELLEFWAANQKVIMVDIKGWIRDFAYGLGFLVGLVIGVGKKIYEFAESHKSLTKFVEAIVVVVAALAALNLAFGKVFSTGASVFGIFSKIKGLLTTGVAGWAFAIGLLVVAVHDLWNAVHGKPTWIQHFIDWLGIGKEVEAVFFAIFQLVSDLMHLKFGDALKDVIGDFKGVKDYFSKTFDFGSVGKAVGNIVGVPALGGAPSGVTAGGGSTKENYQINAPINIHVPGGTDPTMVGKSVKEGVRDHLDRVYRETHRSLRASQAY